MSLFLLLHYFVRIRYIISGEEISSPITDIYPGNRKYSIFHSFRAKRFAAPPNAYYLGVTTQQWSIDIKEILTRTLRIKQRFFNLIKSGKKTFEVRVGYDTINHIQSGEQINLVNHTSQLSVRVSTIRRYSNFKEMLLSEKFSSIAPDVPSSEELLTLLRNIYPPHKEQLGVVVFEIKK